MPKRFPPYPSADSSLVKTREDFGYRGGLLTAADIEAAARLNPMKALSEAFKQMHGTDLDTNHGENYRELFVEMSKADLVEAAVMLSSDAWMWRQKYLDLMAEGCGGDKD